MPTTTGEEVARKLQDAFAALNRHDVRPYVAMMAPDFEIHDPDIPIKGKEAARKLNESLLEVFPDLTSKTLRVAVGGNVVAVEALISGTFKGPLKLPQGTIPPTGRHFEFTYAAFYGFNSDGLLTEVRNYGADLRTVLGLKG